jgi:hypothetical protein
LNQIATSAQTNLPQGTNSAHAPKPPGNLVVVKKRDDWVDIAWSLINSEEFLYHH